MKRLRFPSIVMLRPFRGQLGVLCILTVAQSVLQVAMALLSRFVIDAALTPGGNIALWGGLLAADLLLMVLLHTVCSWLAGSITDKSTAQLRFSLLRSAVYSQEIRLQGFHSGQLLSRGMEDVHTVCDGVVNALPTLLGQVTRLLAAFAALMLISPMVAVVLLAAAVVVCVAAALLRPGLRRQHQLVRRQDEKVMSTMQEDLQQLELIQSLDAQKPILFRFQKRQENSLAAKRRRRIWQVSINSVINTATLAGSGGMLLWGAGQVAAGGLSYGSLTSMIQLFTLFRGPVLSLSGLWSRLAAVEVASERLSELLDTQMPTVSNADSVQVQAVVFRDVTFCYPGEETAVLEHFSARFPLEKWACLTGISGKGKTTLFKLILGLYTPQSGEVYLQTSKGIVPCGSDTRSLFAYVPQDYALFSGTILENLELVAPGSETAVKQALSTAKADFVWELTVGEQTLLRENNTGLSKGQLQRLAIARAILMDRPIFLLDECTSALDAETEAQVLRELHALGKQAILVTHRPEALQELPGIAPVIME